MALLLYAIFVLFASLLTHLLLWRIRLPKAQMQTLLIIFTCYALLGGCFAFAQAYWMLIPTLPTLTYPEVVQLVIFNSCVGMFYTALYSTITVDSPSALLILMTDKAGAEGISRAAICQAFQDMDLYYQARLDKLLESGMVVQQAGRYILMPKGKYFVQLIVRYRQILGLPADIG